MEMGAGGNSGWVGLATQRERWGPWIGIIVGSVPLGHPFTQTHTNSHTPLSDQTRLLVIPFGIVPQSAVFIIVRGCSDLRGDGPSERLLVRLFALLDQLTLLVIKVVELPTQDPLNAFKELLGLGLFDSL